VKTTCNIVAWNHWRHPNAVGTMYKHLAQRAGHVSNRWNCFVAPRRRVCDIPCLGVKLHCCKRVPLASGRFCIALYQPMYSRTIFGPGSKLPPRLHKTKVAQSKLCEKCHCVAGKPYRTRLSSSSCQSAEQSDRTSIIDTDCSVAEE
jgi:hypothetical protein